jgi:hypothetical protein
MENMAHKKKQEKKSESSAYTVEDALKIADEIFTLSKNKKYNLGAFIHGLIFALEYAQFSYKIPQQQMAIIKRDCRKYFKEIENIKK